MNRLEFGRQLTALEIRDPLLEACRTVAAEEGLFIDFDQPQQRALEGFPGQRGRKRIGNGKHKDWFVRFQPEHPSTNRDKTNPVGIIVVRSLFDPANKQFGGFSYGEYGEPDPTYDHITLHNQSEVTDWRPIDLEPELWDRSVDAIELALHVPAKLFEP